jgi:hypothetical protein
LVLGMVIKTSDIVFLSMVPFITPTQGVHILCMLHT